MNPRPIFDAISFIASIASLILAIGAIWLSVVFYKMSDSASKATTEAAKGIAASVERLEKLFDKLYSDTFSMMRDTVSDMRKHMWPVDNGEQENVVEEAEKKTDARINELRTSMENQLSQTLRSQKMAEHQVRSLQDEMRVLIERAIVKSREAESEAREETIREHILRTLRVMRRTKGTASLAELADRLSNLFPTHRIISEITRMKADGLVSLSPDEIGPSSEVRILSTEAPVRVRVVEPDVSAT